MHEVYQGPHDGPFRCSHCRHAFQGATVCHQHAAVLWITQHYPTRQIGVFAKIEPEGCCDFYETVGRG